MRNQTITQGRKDRNAARVEAMYACYSGGMSLSQVGILFGITRQATYDLFRTRNLPLRAKKFKPFVEFNGRAYSERPSGYWAATSGDRMLLHRAIWEHHNGPIPRGYDIHHRDENKANNAIENLECLPKSEHTRLYSPHNNQYTRGRKRVRSA